MLTTTSPFSASGAPSYTGTSPEPLENPPPYTYTSTGRRSPLRAAVHTLRKRQSSLTGPRSRNSVVHGPNGVFGPCMHDAPNLSAARREDHLPTRARGGRQRSSPTGGAAYGMPRYARTPGRDA